MAESHLETDHHGWVGEAQLRWFAKQLGRFEEQGWLRLGVVHHNLIRKAMADDENLRDADDLEAILAPHLNLILHGHTHDAKLHRLGRGMPVLSTGSAAVTKEARPAEVPNQYQFVRIHSDRIERWARCYQPDQKRWVGDNRISADGSSWHDVVSERFERLYGTFPQAGAREVKLDTAIIERDQRGELRSEPDDFAARVAEVCALRNPLATVTRRVTATDPPLPYLRVVAREDGVVRQYPVGVCEHGVTSKDLELFVNHVHSVFRTADPMVVSELVYGGDPADQQLAQHAWHRGVHLVSFIEHQGVLDLRGYVDKQTGRLQGDRVYPPELYIPQRFRLLDTDNEPQEDLLTQAMGWVDSPQGRFVLVLGDFGRGKTFLLHELARRIPEQLPHLVPLLIQLRALEKARGLDELIAQHLVAAGEDRFERQAFRYMLREGRVVLLFDGFDELALRVTYDRAADHLTTLVQAAEGRAKVVVSSRTQHFRSEQQMTTALGSRVELLPGRRLVAIEDFDDDQILAFLGKLYGGDEKQARARFELLRDVRDLLGLSRNPRMLSFIADLPDGQLRQARDRHGEITAADLYRLILDRWLAFEGRRVEPRGAAPGLSVQDRYKAMTHLALRLWQTTERSIDLAELTSTVSEVLGDLAERRLEVGQAAHAVGSGTLLVRSEEDQFAFVHQSVMEWLVANYAADAIASGDHSPEILGARKMSPLMAEFFIGLVNRDRAREWANSVRTAPSTLDVAKANALLVLDRLGEEPLADSQLVGQELSGASLSGRDLHGADLHGADLTEARLVGTNLAGANLSGAQLRGANLNEAILTGADLTGADLTGARLLGAVLRDIRLSGSRWRRAALIGARLKDGALDGADTYGAAIGAMDVEPQFSPAVGFSLDLASSPDGELLAVGGNGGTVWILDWNTRRFLLALQGHQGTVHGVAFSPDGQQLATAGIDGTVRLWDLASGQERHTLQGHQGAVYGVAFSPDGQQLVARQS